MVLHSKDDTQSNKHTSGVARLPTGADPFVNPGACILGDQFMHCALEEAACHGKTFKSHREIQGTEFVKKCKGGFSSHRGDHIGMCATDREKYICTGHSSNCALAYAEYVPYCNLQYNHFPQAEVPFALYGKCIRSTKDEKIVTSKDATCVWSADDCFYQKRNSTDYSTFIPGFQQVNIGSDHDYDNLCTCDKVRVGACMNYASDYLGCAVSEDSCDAESIFKTWHQLHHLGIDCRLCDAFDKTEPVEKYPTPQFLNQLQAAAVPAPKCNVAGAIIGGILSGVVATLLVGWVVLRCKTGKFGVESRSTRTNTNDTEDPEVESVGNVVIT